MCTYVHTLENMATLLQLGKMVIDVSEIRFIQVLSDVSYIITFIQGRLLRMECSSIERKRDIDAFIHYKGIYHFVKCGANIFNIAEIICLNYAAKAIIKLRGGEEFTIPYSEVKYDKLVAKLVQYHDSRKDAHKESLVAMQKTIDQRLEGVEKLLQDLVYAPNGHMAQQAKAEFYTYAQPTYAQPTYAHPDYPKKHKSTDESSDIKPKNRGGCTD